MGNSSTITVTYTGGTCTLTDEQGNVQTATSSPHVFTVYNAGKYTAKCVYSGQTKTETITVTDGGQKFAVTLSIFSATLKITYPSGATCTAKKGTETLTAPDTSGTWNCTVTSNGTWTVTATKGSDTASENANVTTSGSTVNVSVSFLKIVTFASGTDAEIAKMLEAYYNNKITLNQMGWAVGNTRKIRFNAMTAPNGSSGTWAAQDITIVITATEYNTLATPINGHTKACITVEVREVMNNNASGYNQAGHIYVNGDSAYDKTFTPWKNLYMRTYLNSTVYNAISNTLIKSAIKDITHYCHTAYNTSATEQVTDKLFLPSYPEIFGTASYANYTVTSPVEGTQWPYYATASNRIKYGNNNGASNGVAQWWWEGSPSSYYFSSNGYDWCYVDTSGFANGTNGVYAYGLAPAFAL